ncbi:ABZJ_00895 family protein [Marinobacter fonticola]|uniref:ABZJ_00895 family protein n=1 Tax=Marinobacter fonticola TaxID=2603215 RepID=UPI0011E85777|nr:ABZJ_00895 family protein [Marinobacter fonticola]
MKLQRYFILFGVIYVALMAAISLIVYFTGTSLGFIASLAYLVGAGTGAASLFVREQQHAPDAAEKRKLALGCVGVTFAISIVTTLSLVVGNVGLAQTPAALSSAFSALSPLAWLAVLVVIALVYYGILSLFFGWFAQRQAARQR